MTTEDRLSAVEAELRSLTSTLKALIGRPGRATASGVFKPPANLQPAIDALTPRGRARMYDALQGREPTADAIAQAADWEREQAA
jgi:hypothetical protein